MNILFLTAATGGGHVKAALALMKQMEKQIPDCKTNLVDSLKYINPIVDRLITGTYLITIRKTPGIYGKLYDISEKDEYVTDLVKVFNNILSRRLYRLFEQQVPSAVICTHTIPLQMLSRLKVKGLLNIPLIGIVTDFSNHYFWKLDGIDAFIVPHEFIKQDMLKMGIPESRVYTCGIPVAEDFLTTSGDKRQALENLGLENKPTLLLMGGSLGFGDIRTVFASLLSVRRDIQIIVVAGSNKKLKASLENIAQNSDKNIRVFGYTDRISELMDASSLLITKPGGITISEALVKKLPILIMTPIPGQEERNARFLINAGASVRITQCDDMEAMLEKILDKPYIMQNMSEAAAKLARPHACEDIAGIVEKLVLKESAACYIG